MQPNINEVNGLQLTDNRQQTGRRSSRQWKMENGKWRIKDKEKIGNWMFYKMHFIKITTFYILY